MIPMNLATIEQEHRAVKALVSNTVQGNHYHTHDDYDGIYIWGLFWI